MATSLQLSDEGLLKPVRALANDWTFVPSRAGLDLRTKRFYLPLLHSRKRPRQVTIEAVTPRPTWLVYFVFCPNDRIGSHHLFTLSRLRDSGLPIMIVCACSDPARVPAELTAFADALYWKGLHGYDFSAYTLALEAISAGSPGATAFVLNDSMFGPFYDLRPFLEQARWELTGFTASALNENHVQSYAFIMQGITPSRVERLRDVFYRNKAYNDVDAVIWCQETRMARVAHRSMTVGAFFYNDCAAMLDPCLETPFDMVDAGFPFMKRSLLGKMRQFQDPERVRHYLSRFRHPQE